jgi:hypothetical protein
MLVAAVERYGESIGCFRRVVRCGSDLESNAFWESVGYHFVGTDESGEARKYKRSHINLWVKPLFPAVVATAWVNGRPRIYASNAERQQAYCERRRALGLSAQPSRSTGCPTGRPRIYASDADRLRAWRARKRNPNSQNYAVETEPPVTKIAETVLICPTGSECRQFEQ